MKMPFSSWRNFLSQLGYRWRQTRAERRRLLQRQRASISGAGYEPLEDRRVLSVFSIDFQVSAVKTLARRVVNRGGAMLGDVVGLGNGGRPGVLALAVVDLVRVHDLVLVAFRPDLRGAGPQQGQLTA